MQGRAIKAAEVTDLASLPGKPELYAKLLFVLQAPMVQLVSVLNAPCPRPDERAGAGREKAIRVRNGQERINRDSQERANGRSDSQQQVVDYIKGISVLELSQLVKELEKELGVSAAAAMPMAMPAGGGAAAGASGGGRGEDRVHRIADRSRQQQDQRHQGRSRSDEPRTEGSEGPGRGRAQADQGRHPEGRGARQSRRSSRTSAPRSRSSNVAPGAPRLRSRASPARRVP